MRNERKLRITKNQFLNAIGTVLFAAPVVLGLASATPSHARTQAQVSTAPAPMIEFEVASIKPTKIAVTNGFMRMSLRNTDDGLSAENMPLMLLIQSAYGVARDRITGFPDSANSERYDIEAKVDGAAVEALKKMTPDQLKIARQHMLQTLLAERFGLKVHRETKELPVYNLVIAKNGPKLQESKPEDKTADSASAKKDTDGTPAKKALSGGPLVLSGPDGGTATKTVTVGGGGGGPVVSFGGGRGGLRSSSGKGASIESILTTISAAAGRPVLDKTGLKGKYDYKLEWAPEESQADADSNGPSIFTAVQEQLGLKLESAKGPVEILVIDHVEKVVAN